MNAASELIQIVFDLIGVRVRDQYVNAPWRPAPAKSAAINRWTGKPHEHARAKARALRQRGILRFVPSTGAQS